MVSVTLELKRLVKDPEGNFEATWVLTQEQMAVLYWFAINELVGRGMVQVIDISPEQLEQMKKEAEAEGALDFLKTSDIKDLPQA